MVTHLKMNAVARAKNLVFMPGMFEMNDSQLVRMGLDPSAVRAVQASYDKAKSKPEMAGSVGSEYALDTLKPGAWSVVAKDALKRWFEQTTVLNAFSTTYSQEFRTPAGGEVDEMYVNVYDLPEESVLDHNGKFSEIVDGKCSAVKIELHSLTKAFKVTAKDLSRGVDVSALAAGAIERLHRDAENYVLTKLIPGAKQYDDESKVIKSATIMESGYPNGFEWGYANRCLSELVQPHADALLVNSALYGALKRNDADSLRLEDLDFGMVDKIRKETLTKTGVENLAGWVINKRGVAVGMMAPVVMKDAFSSVEQLSYNGRLTPITVSTFYDADANCMIVAFGTMVGCTITDVTGIAALVSTTDGSILTQGPLYDE